MAGSSSAKSLSNLLQRTEITDHEEILHAASTALKSSKNDTRAARAQVVALIKLDRYDEAFEVLQNGPAALRADAPLEWAYTLYKTGRLTEAQDAAASTDGTRGIQHVDAQASYRAEDFDRAFAIYQTLGRETSTVENEAYDLRINGSATLAQRQWAHQTASVYSPPAREDLEAFETAYNAACNCIAHNRLRQALFLLQRARDLCNATESMTEEEKKAEILPITVQHAYVSSRLGRESDAEKLLQGVSPEHITDLSTRKIATVNDATGSSKSQNPYLVQRVLGATPTPESSDKPFEYQSLTITKNERTADLKCGKYGSLTPSSENTPATKSTLSPTPNSISVLAAAAQAKSQTGSAAIKVLVPLFAKRPNDIGLLLTLIQLYILKKDHASAIALLEKVFERLEKVNNAASLEIRFAPGLVSVLISLYHIQHSDRRMRAELSKAASYWQQKNSRSQHGPLHSDLLKHAGFELVKSHDIAELDIARNIFSEMNSHDSSDHFSAAGSVAAVAALSLNNGPAKNRQQDLSDLVKSLKSPVELIGKIDVNQLESDGIARLPTASVQADGAAGKKRTRDEGANKAKKKPRKGRLPKDYDPSKQPDPERWLPLRDRSYWKPKGKKKKGKAGGGGGGERGGLTQGGFDESTPANNSQVATSQGGGGSSKPKKKKSGKR